MKGKRKALVTLNNSFLPSIAYSNPPEGLLPRAQPSICCCNRRYNFHTSLEKMALVVDLGENGGERGTDLHVTPFHRFREHSLEVVATGGRLGSAPSGHIGQVGVVITRLGRRAASRFTRRVRDRTGLCLKVNNRCGGIVEEASPTCNKLFFRILRSTKAS